MRRYCVFTVRRIAPIFAVANISRNQSGTFVAQMATFSPFWMPIAISPRARRSVCSPTWRQVMR